ncbi:MAG TPA: AbrB/MazE/SpoVT family DNA-binding domain-containing protein [Caulobacteraceae bacterium]|jgi:AbrB family looped-hinge helix DNA binding protein|nr:AbrB/MazE/SpoVT family DNA-binding domain-containing protein [Caulobacteraceae bacterium]
MPADDGPPRTKLSTKGQVVLPKEVRRRLKWEPGAELVIEETREGVILKRANPLPPMEVDDVYGMLHRPGMKPITIEEMNEGIVAEARRRHARPRH